MPPIARAGARATAGPGLNINKIVQRLKQPEERNPAPSDRPSDGLASNKGSKRSDRVTREFQIEGAPATEAPPLTSHRKKQTPAAENGGVVDWARVLGMKQERPNSVKGKKGKGKPDVVGAFKKALPSGSSRAKGSKRSQPSQRSRRTGSPMNDEEEAESGEEEEAAPSSEPPTTAESSDAAGAPDAMSLGAIIEEDEVAAAAEAPSAAAAPAAVVEAAAAAPEHAQDPVDPEDLTCVYTAPSVFVLDFTTAAAGCYQINGWGARFTPPFVEQAQRGDVYELLVGDVALGRFQYAPVAEMAKPEDGFVNADGRLRVSSRNMGGETVHMLRELTRTGASE